MNSLHLPADTLNPYNRRVAEGLAEAGLDCELWTDPPRRGSPRRLLPRLRRAPLVHWHWLESFYQARTPLRFLARTALFASVMLELRLRGIPQVVTVHNLLPHERRLQSLHRLACRAIGALADRLLVHSPEAVEPVARLYGARVRIRVVPHVDYADPAVTASRQQLRERWELEDQPRWAIVFGGVRPYKRIHLAVGAARALEQRGIGLIVAGPCPDEAYREELLAAAEGSSTRFVLRSLPESELSELLLASDLALMPHGESLSSGTAVLALAHGLPIVATESDAFRELSGRRLVELCRFESDEAIAETAEAALHSADESWRRRVEAWRRERSPASVGRALARVYAELGDGASGPAA